MWPSRLFWKLLAIYTVLNLALAGVYALIAIHWQEAELISQATVEAGAEVIDEHTTSTRNLLWGLALLLAPPAAVVSHLAVQRIARTVSQLRLAVDALAGGDYAKRVAVSGSEELDALGAQFNLMQHTLSNRVNELQSNSERLQTVLGSMVEGVIAVDTNERILLANEASKSLLGSVTPEVIGRPLREVTRSRAVHEAVVEAFRTAAPCRSEFEVPGASRRVLALRAGRLPGTPCPGVLVVLHDVTDLRRLENLRREFIANVSHELKTPLASIKAYAETLRMGAMHDPEHNLAFIHRIEEQAERLHQLILDMLALARVESGQEAFEMADVELAGLVESCVEQHADVAAAKQISVQTVPAERPVLARADEEGLRTILNNLVDNAIKYTPEGGRVTLRWWAEEALAVFEVQDTGIGIARVDQERIFERFYRVDRARSRELGGTGLGLSIVKHLAQAFGGQVALTSRPGEGSTFQIRLPHA